MEVESRTPASLLGKLQDDPTDQAAWAAFVDRYGPKIYGWCRRWGLKQQDAEEVTEEVLAFLVVRLKTFEYDPEKGRFRSFLRKITEDFCCDFVRRESRAAATGGDIFKLLHNEVARDDLSRRLEEEFDLELQEEAMQRVQQRVKPENWEAFTLSLVDGLPPADVAKRLGIGIAKVYVARHRIQKMLREEIEKLEAE